MAWQEAPPEQQQRDRYHPPCQQDGDPLLKVREKWSAFLEPGKMSAHQIIKEPGIGARIQRTSISKHSRQVSQFFPELLQIEMKIKINAQKNKRSDYIEAHNGNGCLHDRE